mmetsp:Transcript_70162/g.123995  ORF Transcript_70162/g.123995 Transcript_70162/m.123995 type:complete len:344 (+) Transcript_70162:227-1258(+)
MKGLWQCLPREEDVLAQAVDSDETPALLGVIGADDAQCRHPRLLHGDGWLVGVDVVLRLVIRVLCLHRLRWQHVIVLFVLHVFYLIFLRLHVRILHVHPLWMAIRQLNSLREVVAWIHHDVKVFLEDLLFYFPESSRECPILAAVAMVCEEIHHLLDEILLDVRPLICILALRATTIIKENHPLGTPLFIRHDLHLEFDSTPHHLISGLSISELFRHLRSKEEDVLSTRVGMNEAVALNGLEAHDFASCNLSVRQADWLRIPVGSCAPLLTNYLNVVCAWLAALFLVQLEGDFKTFQLVFCGVIVLLRKTAPKEENLLRKIAIDEAVALVLEPHLDLALEPHL